MHLPSERNRPLPPIHPFPISSRVYCGGGGGGVKGGIKWRICMFPCNILHNFSAYFTPITSYHCDVMGGGGGKRRH